MECKHLYCYEPATQRVTVPKHEPYCPLCDKHAEELLAWAKPWLGVLGMVQIDWMRP